VLLDDPPLGHELAKYLSQGQANGEIRTDVDPNQAGELLALGYVAALTGWIKQEPPAYELEPRLLTCSTCSSTVHR
jgi:hypothetical protein